MAGRRTYLAFVLLSAGCDVVFGTPRLYECPPDDDDCDKLLDPVDPCPADPGDAKDGDGDGVGDACDPNLEAPVDSLLEFEGFVMADDRWVARGSGSWEIRDSALALDDGAVERAVATNSQPTIEVLLDPAFADEGSTVGVLVASMASTGIPLECRIEHHAAGDDLVMLLGDPAMGTPYEIGRARQLPGTASDGLRIYGTQLPDFTIRCRARYGANDALYVDWQAFTLRVDFDTIGFRVGQGSAAYRSLAIYTTAP